MVAGVAFALVIAAMLAAPATGGGGSEQQVQVLFKARAHVDLEVEKHAYVSGQGEVDTVREGKDMTWLVTIRNRSGFRLKPGDVKLTEVLPKGFEIDRELPSNLPPTRSRSGLRRTAMAPRSSTAWIGR